MPRYWIYQEMLWFVGRSYYGRLIQSKLKKNKDDGLYLVPSRLG
jgi:hypothetical protein